MFGLNKALLNNLLIVALIVIVTGNELNSKIKMQPYLQAVAHNSIVVMAVCDSKNDVTVDFGKTTDYGKQVVSSNFVKPQGKQRYVFRIKLEGLEPNTVYNYKVTQEEEATGNEIFRTAATLGTPFKFGIFGDCRSNPDIHAIVIKELKKMEPYFSIYTGDLCTDGKYETWIKEFFIDHQLDLIKNVPFFNNVGNHEGTGANTKAFLQAPESPSNNQFYYSFEYGDAFFLVINSEADIGPDSKQFEFAKNAIKGTNKKWKVASWHSPAYCAGGHGPNAKMQEFTKALLIPAGFDFVLNGHSHFYQHNFVDGIRHLIIGGGGAPLYGPAKDTFTIKSAKSYNFALAEVKPESFKITVYNEKSQVIDAIEIIK
jgi:acid phosphatase type 7